MMKIKERPRGIKMEINYREIADKAVASAAESNIRLDYSKESIALVDALLGTYHDHLTDYKGEDGAQTLWNVAVHFGIYLGETLLRLRLKDAGFTWCVDEGMPILCKGKNEISPITKAHKRILYGADDSVKSFCDVAFSVAAGKFPTDNVRRAVDMQTASGHTILNVLFRDIAPALRFVDEGAENFLILKSHDGFLQFYGVNNRFVAEIRINLADGDFRTYSLIAAEKANLTERISLITPYGQFTPTAREVISFQMLEAIVEAYYNSVDEEGLLAKISNLTGISYIETTAEMKKCMGMA